MHDDAAFHAAIDVNPEDDLPRLVFADYLDETGRPELAAGYRAVAALGKVPQRVEVPVFSFATGREVTGEEWSWSYFTERFLKPGYLPSTWWAVCGRRYGSWENTLRDNARWAITADTAHEAFLWAAASWSEAADIAAPVYHANEEIYDADTLVRCVRWPNVYPVGKARELILDRLRGMARPLETGTGLFFCGLPLVGYSHERLVTVCGKTALAVYHVDQTVARPVGRGRIALLDDPDGLAVAKDPNKWGVT